MTPFSPIDRWVLTRVLHGYSLGAGIPEDVSFRAKGLLLSWTGLKRRDCELLLKNNCTRQEFEAILTGDPNAPKPPPAADEPPFMIILADDLYKLPPLTWLIPGEIVEGGLCILYGESGVGKSFVALDYAMRLASAGMNVLYAPTEGEAGYRKRVEAWKAFHRVQSVPSLSFLFGGIVLTDVKLMGEITPHLDRIKPKLLIIDTLAMGMVGLDENSARDVGVFMASCRALIRRTGTALLLVHHTGKSGVVERGSTAIRGNADTMIKLSNADDLVFMECAKTKDEAPFPARYIKLVEFQESLIPMPSDKVVRDEATITPNQARLLDVLLLETSIDGLSQRDMAEATGLSLGAVQRALSNLIRKKLVKKGKTGYVRAESGESGESGESHDSRNILQSPARSGDSPDSTESVIRPGEMPGMPKPLPPRAAAHWRN